ncbi:MAG: GT2 family glycosyltransferase [Candidatus Azotimanducaceae bacterium]|jgi:GT2 family glycosyltransferase
MTAIGLCAIIRDESRYLNEWIEYYSLIGITKFYIYDDGSKTPILESLSTEIESGKVVLETLPSKFPQIEAYNHCLKKYGNECRWLALLDIDEFIVLTEHLNLHSFLMKFNSYGGVGLNWLMYGPSGHDHSPLGTQIENYLLRLPKQDPVNRHIKTIIQTDKVSHIPNPHYAIYKDDYYCVNENNERIDGAFCINSVKKARINHYFTRSKEDFMEKIVRSQDKGNIRTVQDFNYYNSFATIEDASALRFLNELRGKNESDTKRLGEFNKGLILSEKFTDGPIDLFNAEYHNTPPPLIKRIQQARWSGAKSEKDENNSGLTQMDGTDSISRKEIIDQDYFLKVVNPDGAPWAYFQFLTPSMSLAASVIIEVELLCDSDTEVWIEYDSSDRSVEIVPSLPGAFKPTLHQTVVNDGKKKRFSFYLHDADFNRRVNGADFRVVMAKETGLPMYIHQVNITDDSENSELNSESTIDRNLYQYPIALDPNNIELHCSESPEISIIMPTYNRPEFTLQCLNYLAQNTTANYEIILVDDGSDLATSDVIRKIRNIKFLWHAVNKGYATACNNGAKQAKGRYLVFLNNDTVPLAGWLSGLLSCAVRYEKIGVVGSKLIYPFTEKIQHAGVGFIEDGRPYHLHHLCSYKHEESTHEREVAAVTGACFFTPSELFEELGGFDDTFVNGYEDIDYCLRAQKLGKRIFYCPTSQLFHYESVSEGRFDAEETNLNLFLARWGIEPYRQFNLVRAQKT